jgi:hypothetical protein
MIPVSTGFATWVHPATTSDTHDYFFFFLAAAFAADTTDAGDFLTTLPDFFAALWPAIVFLSLPYIMVSP